MHKRPHTPRTHSPVSAQGPLASEGPLVLLPTYIPEPRGADAPDTLYFVTVQPAPDPQPPSWPPAPLASSSLGSSYVSSFPSIVHSAHGQPSGHSGNLGGFVELHANSGSSGPLVQEFVANAIVFGGGSSNSGSGSFRRQRSSVSSADESVGAHDVMRRGAAKAFEGLKLGAPIAAGSYGR